jgi:hypothetical protein
MSFGLTGNRGVGGAICALLAVGVMSIAGSSALAEIAQDSTVRVVVSGKLSPQRLPRTGAAPVRVAIGAKIGPSVEGVNPPPLRQISIEINRNGRLDSTGLPLCPYHDVQPATTARALEACRSSLVGRGTFSSNVLQAAEAPFPSEGELYAFIGTYKGQPAILAHIYGSSPIPISYTIPFSISKAKGAYGTRLTAPMPRLSSEWGYITGLSLNLGRNYSYRGERRSYASGSCPTPKGVPIASFPFARTTFNFSGRKLTETLTRSCRAR